MLQGTRTQYPPAGSLCAPCRHIVHSQSSAVPAACVVLRCSQCACRCPSSCTQLQPGCSLQVYARRKFFHPPTRMATYYQSVVQNVRAEKQVWRRKDREHLAGLCVLFVLLLLLAGWVEPGKGALLGFLLGNAMWVPFGKHLSLNLNAARQRRPVFSPHACTPLPVPAGKALGKLPALGCCGSAWFCLCCLPRCQSV